MIDITEVFSETEEGTNTDLADTSIQQAGASSIHHVLQLKQMYPNHEETYLKNVLLETASIHDAIAQILPNQDKPVVISG